MSKRRYFFWLWIPIVVILYVSVVVIFGAASVVSSIVEAASQGKSSALTAEDSISITMGWLTGPTAKAVLTLVLLSPPIFLLILFFKWLFRSTSQSVYLYVTPHAMALYRADAVLKFLGLFLPSRIMKEDAGDTREAIGYLLKENSPAWMIYTRLASGVFWILIATLREVLSVTKKKPN